MLSASNRPRNFRSGWIAAFNGFTHEFIGFLKDKNNSLITIDGLWSLTFGNDAKCGRGKYVVLYRRNQQRK